MSSFLTACFFHRQVIVFSRLPSSAGVDRPLCAKWIDSAFKNVSWRARILLRLGGRLAVALALVEERSGTPIEPSVVHDDCEETGDALSTSEACEDVSGSEGWILG